MSLVHQKLYQNNTFSQINFGQYIEKLITNIQHSLNISNKNIEISIEADLNLDIERAIPLALISNELITNSFKYAFKDNQKGEISVNLTEDKKYYTLTIKDNGEGIENLKINEYKTLGLNLVQMLSRQLHGNLEITTNGGLIVEIKFPIQID